MIIAICPGTFDPIQNGHIDIIKRASNLADLVYVVVGVNPDKQPLFSVDERIKLIKKVTKDIPNIQIAYNEGLTVDFAKKVGASLIIKGYRDEADLAYEEEMAFLNKQMAPAIDTILLKASLDYINVSSSSIKDAIASNQDISSYLPKEISKFVYKKIKRQVK